MDEHTKHLRGGHETTDVNIWAIGKFGVALVILTILSIGLLIGVFRFFESRTAEGTAVNPTKIFPKPQLQSEPVIDLKAFRHAEDQVLHSYGWVDQQKGIARIPIDQAIDRLAAKGLPVRQTQPAAPTVSVPTESGPGVISAPAEAKPAEQHEGHEK